MLFVLFFSCVMLVTWSILVIIPKRCRLASRTDATAKYTQTHARARTHITDDIYLYLSIYLYNMYSVYCCIYILCKHICLLSSGVPGHRARVEPDIVGRRCLRRDGGAAIEADGRFIDPVGLGVRAHRHQCRCRGRRGGHHGGQQVTHYDVACAFARAVVILLFFYIPRTEYTQQ